MLFDLNPRKPESATATARFRGIVRRNHPEGTNASMIPETSVPKTRNGNPSNRTLNSESVKSLRLNRNAVIAARPRTVASDEPRRLQRPIGAILVDRLERAGGQLDPDMPLQLGHPDPL